MTTWMESLPGWHRAYHGRKSIGDVREVGVSLERARLRYVTR